LYGCCLWVTLSIPTACEELLPLLECCRNTERLLPSVQLPTELVVEALNKHFRRPAVHDRRPRDHLQVRKYFYDPLRENMRLAAVKYHCLQSGLAM
jgi:hypothetical protein